jgi:heterodisulfide reductase subunit A
VLPGISFLKDASLGKPVKIGKTTLVIGGGNVAVDVAMTAKRLGAENVSMACLESRNEMPAWEYEIKEAIEEQIRIINSLGPNRFVEKDGKVSGVEFKQCLRVFDEKGRFNPRYDDNALTILDADTVIVAIGQSNELDFAKNQNIAVTARGGIEADPITFQTPIPWVFAGGDGFYGPKSVVDAVGCGKGAAESIHRFINAMDLKEGREKDWRFEKPETKNALPMQRAIPLRLEPDKRAGNFDEIVSGLSEIQAGSEAERCLNCGGCSECLQCVQACEVKAIDHEMKEERIQVDAGALIVATGFKPFDPTPLTQYGYGRFPEVYTSMQFERMNNATGPTAGKILMKNGNPPQRVAIVHCVGSRDVNHRKYCSRVCCMYSMKFAHLIKEKTGAEIWEFYIDIRAPGKLYEEFYNRIQEEGVHLIRGRVAEITDIVDHEKDKGRLTVLAENTLTRRTLRIPVDMVILSVALEPADGIDDIGRIVGVARDSDGWLNELHAKLAPVSTATGGIFLAGCCQGPKDIPDTVAQSMGAAGEAIALLAKGTVKTRAEISLIDPDLCSGCKTCIGVCAYSAIRFDETRGISVVNEALCQGCGSCAAACPSSAAGVKHFTDKQVMGEIESLLL